MKLTKLSVATENPTYYVDNNAIVSKRDQVLLYMPVKTNGDYEFSEGISEVGEFAFNCCEGIRNIYIPATVIRIGNAAFKSCPRLEDFFCYGRTAPSFQNAPFNDTKNLKTLHIPHGCRQEYLDKGWTMFQEIKEDLSPLIPGDVNQDNVVDISDIVVVINQMAGSKSYRYSDVNGDNKTDISDIVAIINEIAVNSNGS